MGLRDVQHGLARLLTDDGLRERFGVDPQGVAQTLNLDAADAVQLSLLASAEVERFARSLRAKRWNEIQKLLPVSTQAAQNVGFPLRRLFFDFAQTYAPQGGKRHAQDALAFAAWTARQPSETFSIPTSPNAAWLVDLLRYEASWLEMQLMPSRRWMLRRFAYSVPQWVRARTFYAAEYAVADSSPSLRTTLSVWLRLSPVGKLRHCSLSAPKL